MIDTKLGMIDDILTRERDEQLHSSLIEMQVELTSDNYEAFDERLDRRKLGRQVCQTNRLTGIRRRFQMYRNSHLFQQRSHVSKPQLDTGLYRISLCCMRPEAETIRLREWKWLSTVIATTIWTLVLTAITFLMPEFFITFTSVLPQHTASAAVLMGTISIVSLMLFAHSDRDITVIRSFEGGVPLIEMETARPDEASYRFLLNDILQGIHSMTAGMNIQDILIAEIKELRRLRDEGLIEHAVYTQARERIFDHVEYSLHRS